MNYTQLKDFLTKPITALSNALKLSSFSKLFGRVNERRHVDAKMDETSSNFALILLSPKLGKQVQPVINKTKFSAYEYSISLMPVLFKEAHNSF